MERVEKIRAFWFALGLSLICVGMYLTLMSLIQISIAIIFSGVGIAVSGLAYNPPESEHRRRDFRLRLKQYRESYKSTGGKLALVGLGFVLSGLFTFGLLLYFAARAEHPYFYPVSSAISILLVMTVLLLLPGFVLVFVGFIMAKIDQYQQRKIHASS
jgi:hypothetical protein